MAKLARKRNTEVPAPVLTAVAIAVAAIYPALASEAAAYAVTVAAGKSRSATIVDAITVLWETSPDRVADGVAVFGDGLTTAKSVKGELWTKLHADGIKSGSVYTTLSWARTVFAEYGRDDVRKAAAESGLRKARDTAKPKAKAEPDADTGTAPTEKFDAVALVHAHFDEFFTAFQAEFIRMRDPISLAKLGEIQIHLASKTAKTA